MVTDYTLFSRLEVLTFISVTEKQEGNMDGRGHAFTSNDKTTQISCILDGTLTVS